MAVVEERFLERPVRAVAIYKRILEIDDADARALAGLEQAFERSGNWLEMMEILRKRAAVEQSPAVRQQIFSRLASLAGKLGAKRKP